MHSNLGKVNAMKRLWLAMTAFAVCVAAAPAPSPAPAEDSSPDWSADNIATLERWVAMAPRDAMRSPSADALHTAIERSDTDAVDDAATALALRLARMHLLGSASQSERAGWHIEDTDKAIDLERLLRQSLSVGTLDAYFASLSPRHPDYTALRTAYGEETDTQRRRAIARNMERWRWMPRSLGSDYILVNAAQFEARLWRNGEKAGTWRVIVGKPSTPTPVFSTTVTGVILNPWWEIPASIVRESIGSLVRRNPAYARSRGYVWSEGKYRQKPGPNNALGEMKLAMPNRFSVYMHDTPNKELFEQETRAFSHGCIRTGDALGFAATLLEGVKSREEIDAIVETRKTTTVELAHSLPIYITYFTAAPDADGNVEILNDLYHRDGRISVASAAETECAGWQTLAMS